MSSITIPLELHSTLELQPIVEPVLKTTYRILIEGIENNRVLGTCQELENVFVDGKDEEDVMRRIRIVIEEKLDVMGTPNKNFNLRQLITL